MDEDGAVARERKPITYRMTDSPTLPIERSALERTTHGINVLLESALQHGPISVIRLIPEFSDDQFHVTLTATTASVDSREHSDPEDRSTSEMHGSVVEAG